MNDYIGLVDCNSFFCSCEKIFRPELNGKPVIVLSNNDGCAIARTPEAKSLGIKMGEPYFKIKDFCKKNDVHIFSSNFSLYTDISSRVMGVIRANSVKCEVYSIDEAFIDLNGVGDLSDYGQMIKHKILAMTGIPTGVGIARTKVLAKLANRIAKTSRKANGVVFLSSEKLENIILKMTDIGDVWGIGSASTAKLRMLGIKNAYDFKIYKNTKLIIKLLTKVGYQIKLELMGVKCFQVGEDFNKKKEIMCSRTLGTPVSSIEDIKKIVSVYISNVCEKMRKQSSAALNITVYAFTNRYSDSDQHHIIKKSKFSNPTIDTRKIIIRANQLIDESFINGYCYKKVGVKVSGLTELKELQVDLFEPTDSGKDIALMKVIDLINYREGESSVYIASCGNSNSAWSMNRDYKSPRYTTSWSELYRFN